MQAIAQMLTENTGRSMLDSGGAYGRHWERNQGRNFESEPATTLDPSWCREGDEFRPEVVHNVYHWLAERVTEAPEMDAAFQAFAQERRDSEYELPIMEAFALEMGGTGIYGEGKPMTVNTYNGECLLSQVLQYVYFEVDGTGYAILQIHGGCDVRGGYTDAKVFEADDGFLLGNADATITSREGPYWSTDDGYNWYSYDSDAQDLHKYLVSYDPEHKGDGVHVYVDEDARKAYCPITGGELYAMD